MNNEALLEIADLIERSDAKNFHMGSWFGKNVTFDDLEEEDQQSLEHLFSSGDIVNVHTYHSGFQLANVLDDEFQNTLKCDTTACIAGWTVFNAWLKDNNFEFRNVQDAASEILDLGWYETKRLFFCEEGSIWDEVAVQYEFDYDREHPETWNIPSVMVASVLRRIANGELNIHEVPEDYPEDNEEYNDAELV